MFEIAAEAIVRLANVSIIRKGQGGRQTTIIDNISLNVPRGEITTIVGPSGGGKSSLIRLINRLSEPTTGRVFVDGEDIAEIDPLLLRRKIAMVMQKPYMFEGPVLANLQRPFVYSQQPLPDADSPSVRQAMELARLTPDLADRDSRTLSLGQQQRVSLARALITSPEVLLLDEPTSALDRPTADQLATTFHDICRNGKLTLILVTHDLRLAEKVADHLVFLQSGRIVEAGLPGDLLGNPQTAELRHFLSED